MNDQAIEAEIIAPQALAVRPASILPTVQDLEQQFTLAVRQRELLSEYIKKQLVPGKHFYQRGTQKPSLAKEGAEIILLPHNLAPDYEQTGGPDSPPPDGKPYQITVKCILRRKGDPTSFVGSGIGSAGSEKQTKDGKYQPRQGDKYLCHNATLKMAQKSAMIAATINSTAASEFFTQDMDEPGSGEPQGSKRPPPERPTSDIPPTPKNPTTVTQERSKGLKPPTEATRKWMLDELHAEGLFDLAQEYFTKLTNPMPLMPGEPLTNLRLIFVPNTRDELKLLVTRLKQFGNGERAEIPYAWHWEAEGKQAIPAKAALPTESPKDPLWWRDIIIPIPRRGMKKNEYNKDPDTIGRLFDARHKQDEQSEYMRQRLWGILEGARETNWIPQPRKVGDQTYNPTDADRKCYEALRAFDEWFKDNHRGEKI